MKSQKSIFLAFCLNLLFALIELIGGFLTGSTAITSDAVHDLGDAVGIGISYLLERKSHHPPDKRHTYGYSRYSILGAAVTTLILLIGSVGVLLHAGRKLLAPTAVHHDGMLLLAVIGIVINGYAAWSTRSGNSTNLKSVNLHMLEDTLGWILVLFSAIVIRYTGWTILDPIMSMVIAGFILTQAVRHFSHILEILLQAVPRQIDPAALMSALQSIDGIVDVHHMHIQSIDGQTLAATVHIVSDQPPQNTKQAVRSVFSEFSIDHVTIEIEATDEICKDRHCAFLTQPHCHHCH